MPNVRYMGHIYNVRWLPEWDAIILIAGKRFWTGTMINWKKAEAKGYLRGLPANLSVYDFSKRFTYLKRKKKLKKNPPLPYDSKYHMSRWKVRETLFRSQKNSAKLISPRKKWTSKQQEILFRLVKKYQKGVISIAWPMVVKDPLFKLLPTGYSLPRVRSYYWSIKAKENPTALKKHRQHAIMYKARNYKKHVARQLERIKLIRQSVRETLLSKIPLR